MSNRRTTSTTQRGQTKRRPRRHLLILYGVLICVGIGLLIAGQSTLVEHTDVTRPTVSKPNRATSTNAAAEGRGQGVNTPSPVASSGLIDDDGQTLWASPTDGKPHDLAFLPPGVQIIVILRPREILEHPEGEKVLASLGPTGERAVHLVEETTRARLAQLSRVVVGWEVTSAGSWKTTLVAYANDPLFAELPAGLTVAAQKEHGEKAYWLAGDRAYYVPKSRDGRVLVVSPGDAIADIIDLADEAPPLRRDVERLLAHTDEDRHVTIIVTPNSLFSEGRSMFDGEMTRLREPLFWFLGDELSAAALSLHWDENFFFELIATPTLDTSTERAARILSQRIGEIPDKLEAYVVGLDPQPYGRMIVARFPGMIRKLAAYTRSGFESDHAVLRGYLPAVAGHNLLMGAELTLAESPAAAGTAVDATATSAPPAAKTESIRDRLQRSTSLRFARDTLEAALEQLASDIGIEIIIRGPDLQAEGITKNQSFGIDMENKPAEEIMVEILRLANPDKTATGPSDERQKLIYVIAPGQNGAEQIFVTTRAAAATRGDPLPKVFQAERR